MLPISIAIITKDEEHNIEDALKSVSDAQEIIVVDSFSSDRTVEICRKYTEKVYQHEWEGFAIQKQRAVDYASCEWVLVLDADERVTPQLREEIADAISRKNFSAYYIPRQNYFLGRWIKHGGWWPDRTLRLFRKDRGRFERREVHEKIIVDGITGYLTHPLKHFTYRSISEFVQRNDTYSSLAAREILNRSGKAGVFSLTVNPVATFFRMYLLRLGFLDGMRGLVLAALYGYYTFLKYAKTLEMKP